MLWMHTYTLCWDVPQPIILGDIILGDSMVGETGGLIRVDTHILKILFYKKNKWNMNSNWNFVMFCFMCSAVPYVCRTKVAL